MVNVEKAGIDSSQRENVARECYPKDPSFKTIGKKNLDTILLQPGPEHDRFVVK